MTPFAIAGVQMHLHHGDNLEAMRHRLQVMMHLYPWVQMAVFSELCVFGPGLQRAQRLPGPAEDSLRAMAREFDLWLVPGSLYESRDGRIYNTTPVIDPNGEVVARYRKMFPFAPLEEGVAPGDEFCVFEVPDVGKFAVLNCYDLWFPETARTVTAMGAEVILHPVMTHTIDRDVDLNVAKASAAMFQCYLFDINGLDAGGNGQSCVLDPSGRVIHQCGTTEELVPVEVDLEQVRRQRVRGMRTLGQPLKSFRDSRVHFPIYDGSPAELAYLEFAGPAREAAAGPPRPRARAGRAPGRRMIEVTFRAVAEDLPGAALLEQFERTWPAYRAWYLREGEAPRPSYRPVPAHAARASARAGADLGAAGRAGRRRRPRGALPLALRPAGLRRRLHPGLVDPSHPGAGPQLRLRAQPVRRPDPAQRLERHGRGGDDRLRLGRAGRRQRARPRRIPGLWRPPPGGRRIRDHGRAALHPRILQRGRRGGRQC